MLLEFQTGVYLLPIAREKKKVFEMHNSFFLKFFIYSYKKLSVTSDYRGLGLIPSDV